MNFEYHNSRPASSVSSSVRRAILGSRSPLIITSVVPRAPEALNVIETCRTWEAALSRRNIARLSDHQPNDRFAFHVGVVKEQRSTFARNMVVLFQLNLNLRLFAGKFSCGVPKVHNRPIIKKIGSAGAKMRVIVGHGPLYFQKSILCAKSISLFSSRYCCFDDMGDHSLPILPLHDQFIRGPFDIRQRHLVAARYQAARVAPVNALPQPNFRDSIKCRRGAPISPPLKCTFERSIR